MTGRTEKALGVKSMPLNRNGALSETEDFMEENEEKMKELLNDETAMIALELMMREAVAAQLKDFAAAQGIDIEINGLTAEFKETIGLETEEKSKND